MAHIQDVGANAVPAAIEFSRDLLTGGKNGFGLPQVNDKIIAIIAQHDPVDNLAFAVNETRVDDIPLGFLHLLDDDLLGGLGCDPAKRGRVHLYAQAVTFFAFRIEFLPFLEADLKLGVGDFFNHLFKLEDLYLTDLLVVLNLDIHFIAELFPRGRSQSFLESLNKNLPVDTLVTADLIDDTLYVRYKHPFSPL
jgi:hypothetical protein